MISPGKRPSSERGGLPFMDLNEFVERGYLHEVNRQFFHPLGLSLTVQGSDDGVFEIVGIQDHRNDPEGVRFREVNWEKVYSIRDEQEARRPAREEALGYWVQGEDW